MVVILRLRGSPRTIRTGAPAARTAAASSAKDRSPAACRARSRSSRRNACGVCADQSPSRASSSIAVPASSARRTVSASGRPATALPFLRALSTQRTNRDGGANGRALSWIAITSASGAASSAAQLDAVRVSPPPTTIASGTRVRTISSTAASRSVRVTTTIRSNTAAATAAASDHARTGCPPRSAATLSVPARVELPAARIAQAAPSLLLAIESPRAALAHLALQLREDHPAADGLEDPHDRHRQLAAEVARAVLDHDHRAVLEIANTLPLLLSLLDHPHGDLFARQDHRANRLRQVVHVQDRHAMQLGDAVQSVVVRHDRDPESACEGHELRVGARPGRVFLRELHLDGRFLLHLGEHLEPSPPSLTPRGIGRVGEKLELGEDEARHDERRRNDGDIRSAKPSEDRAGCGEKDDHQDLIADRRDLGDREKRRAEEEAKDETDECCQKTDEGHSNHSFLDCCERRTIR